MSNVTAKPNTWPAFFGDDDIDLAHLAHLCNQTTLRDDYDFAAAVEQNILIYDAARVRAALADRATEAMIKAEWSRCLGSGPGVFAVTGAYPDTTVIDRSTAVFQAIIAAEKAAGQGRGDHFGSNERIWNSLQKACLYDPDLFIDYYGNPILALAAQAWLGPHYQMTAQVNSVKPGGKAQSAHRDFHLGFQSATTVAQFPAHAQMMSQYLTLQGAIVHGDMPLASGPTLFLPYSQQYAPGYLAYERPEIAAYFDEHQVQIPFQKGDMVFFSPALFHGAGRNTLTADRLANLVQISSAFGRPMETVNRSAMMTAVYPALQARLQRGALPDRLMGDIIAATADGYAFPTNLDSDPPIGGNAPETAQQLMQRALQADWSVAELDAALVAYGERQAA